VEGIDSYEEGKSEYKLYNEEKKMDRRIDGDEIRK